MDGPAVWLGWMAPKSQMGSPPGHKRNEAAALAALACVLAAGPLEAEWIELPWPQIDATLPLWIPDDDAGSRPAIIHFHGTNGKPNAGFLHQFPEAREFVLVGMSYRHRGRFQYEPQTIADEIGALRALRHTLVNGRTAVDPERIFASGFSKGGWHVAMLLEREDWLAGGLILGAGVFQPETDAGPLPKPVHLGVGRFDGNYPQSLRALVHFRARRAEVTLDAWPDTAHAYPESPPESLRQWLRLAADGETAREPARDWIKKRRHEIDALDDPLARWFALAEFAERPFVARFDPDAAKAAREQAAALRRHPEVAAEARARDEIQRILRLEIQDRAVATLERVRPLYQRLAEGAPETRAGAEARRDLARVDELLEHVREPGTTRRVERVTPETEPATPRGGIDRGGFPLPPGTRVEPAQ